MEPWSCSSAKLARSTVKMPSSDKCDFACCGHDDQSPESILHKLAFLKTTLPSWLASERLLNHLVPITCDVECPRNPSAVARLANGCCWMMRGLAEYSPSAARAGQRTVAGRATPLLGSHVRRERMRKGRNLACLDQSAYDSSISSPSLTKTSSCPDGTQSSAANTTQNTLHQGSNHLGQSLTARLCGDGAVRAQSSSRTMQSWPRPTRLRVR